MSSGKHKPILIVQGAQWGSEAKGAIAAFLCKARQVDLAVRTGAVNAGHTVLAGELTPIPVKMQQLPTGWINPRTKLILGAGAFVNPSILAEEIELVSAMMGEDVRDRLYVDHRVSLHLEEHTAQAKLENRHHAIGATGKGCSVAITDKIRYRGKGYRLFREWLGDGGNAPILAGLQFADTVGMLHDAYDSGQQILLEGTQGSLLDLHLGPYPYTTHKQTQAGQWALESGLGLGMEYEIAMVARTYPIRVAGNSGPMAKETTWSNLARQMNRKLMLRRQGQRVKSFALDEFEKIAHELGNGKWADQLPRHMDDGPNWDFHQWSAEDRVRYRVALSEFHVDVLQKMSMLALQEVSHLFEMTTVTKKLRRIAEWNGPDVAWSCRINRGTYIVLTFFNYWFPELWDHTGLGWCDEYERAVYQVEKDAGIPVKYVSTGPDVANVIDISKLRKGGK